MIQIKESKRDTMISLETASGLLVLDHKPTKVEALNSAIAFLESQLVELREYYHDIPVDKRIYDKL